MTSISISTYSENAHNGFIDNKYIIKNELPNSQNINTNIQSPTRKNANAEKSKYHLFLNTNNFDPNMSSSPPNMFMQNLHERMNRYGEPRILK